MAKRNNNSLGRRTYGGKPYDANNSFVKKMATKVTDLIPQKSWISKWFNASQDNGDASNEDGHLDNGEEETQQPPAKRPRIRMDITHPPGTFSIRARAKDNSNNHETRIANETEEYFLEPAVAGPSGVCKFVSSTPALHTDVRNSDSQRSGAMSHVLRTGNNGASNGADDNSESGDSTSGCSSLIPQTSRQEGVANSAYGTNLAGGRKRFIDDKSSFVNHLQSPRCLFLEGGASRESFDSRRPSFNASMMTNNGNNLERSASLSSPFYSGNVTFGGSNALGSYKRNRSLFNSNNDFQLKIPRRTNVQVKPSNVECIDASAMSQTAKRILQAMEHFSSPISDAKRIPMNSSSGMSMGKKRSRDERSVSSIPTSRVGLRHLTRELAVPTVPDMLKLRRRQKLQDTTVAARKIISAMSVPPPTASWTTTTTMTTTPEAINEEYHLRTDLDNSPKYHGKVRGKSKIILFEGGPPPRVNLPNISLAITSLPSFEPLPKYTIPSVVANRKESKDNEDHRSSYKFSSPIKITEASWNLKSINNFSFSKPINASDSDVPRVDCNTTSTSHDKGLNTCRDGVAINFMCSDSSTAPRLKVKTKPKETNEEIGKVTIFDSSSINEMAKLRRVTKNTDSGMESESTISERKLSMAIWECSECYIKNDTSDNTCVACKASKPRTNVRAYEISVPSPLIDNNGTKETLETEKNVAPETGFGSQFKMNVNEWECESCLVRNKMTSVKCISCSSPKSGTTRKSNDSVNSPSNATGKYNFGEKFKPPEGSWECSGCMLRNPSNVITCPCCSASKPSSVKKCMKKTGLDDVANEELRKIGEKWTDSMDHLKPATSTWECSTCMVRNNETVTSCVCCTTPKAGVTSKVEKASVARATVESGWGDKFKKPEGSWSCDSCMLQNKNEVNECVACNALKPGTIAKPQTTPSQFSFGIPATNDHSFKFVTDKADEKINWATNSDSTNGFSFAAKSAQTAADSSQFTFGMPKESGVSHAPTKISINPTSGFVFASPKTAAGPGPKFDVNKSNEIARDSKSPINEEKKNSLCFGLPKSMNKRPADDSTGIGEGDAKSGPGIPQFVFGVPKSQENRADESKSSVDAATSEKISIFGNKSGATTSNESITVQAVATVKSGRATSDEENGRTLSSSITGPSTNLSAQARSPFTFSEPKSKIATQLSSVNVTPSFDQTSIIVMPPAQTPTFSIAGSPIIRETALNPNENKNKPVASNFGIHNTVTPSSGFGIVTSSSPATVLGGTSSVDAKTCFAPADKQNSTFFAIAGDKRPAVFGEPVEKFPSSDKPGFRLGDKPTKNSELLNAMKMGLAGTPQPFFGSSTTPVFGGNTSAPSFSRGSNVGATSIFAATGTSNVTSAPTSNQGLFTFGGANSQQIAGQSTPGAFTFATDSGDSAVSVAKPVFPFSNTTGTPQPSPNECFGATTTNTGAFGTPATTTTNPLPFSFSAASAKQDTTGFGQASATIPNMFGTQSISSGIGQQPQTPSIFASNAPAPSTGFTFGATGPSTISGGFNFGGGMVEPATVPSSGFNFNAPAPSSDIAFDPNTRPSFNFTGGSAPTAFNATPQPVAARKIKKAVRRMQQR